MKIIFKRAFQFFSVGAMVFLSCKEMAAQSGVPIDVPDFNKKKSTVVRFFNDSNVPIKGLLVQLYSPDSILTMFSDSTGAATYYYLEEDKTYRIEIIDIDGDKNQGNFADKDFVIYRREESLNIIMKEKQNE